MNAEHFHRNVRQVFVDAQLHDHERHLFRALEIGLAQDDDLFDLCEWNEVLTFIPAFEQQHAAFGIDDLGFAGDFVDFHPGIVDNRDALAHVGLQDFSPVANGELARDAVFAQFEIDKFGFRSACNQVDRFRNETQAHRDVGLLVFEIHNAFGGNLCSILKQRDFEGAKCGSLGLQGICPENQQHGRKAAKSGKHQSHQLFYHWPTKYWADPRTKIIKFRSVDRRTPPRKQHKEAG